MRFTPGSRCTLGVLRFCLFIFAFETESLCAALAVLNSQCHQAGLGVPEDRLLCLPGAGVSPASCIHASYMCCPDPVVRLLLSRGWLVTRVCGLAPEDSVFMASEEERAEYVLNDTGYLYMGFAKQIKEKPWTFGQVT